ncbi:MAG: hypothetical protein IDH49_08855 [Gammaproteobacteria bacterium]|nr:hypothetical protein [Gammaproteobacteria bacterium]
MNKMSLAGLVLTAVLIAPAHAEHGLDGSTVIGGALGGAAGAAVGSAAGGREAAIVGSAIGAAAGTAIATRRDRVRVIDDHHHRGRHDNGWHRGHHKHKHKHRHKNDHHDH